MAIRPRQRPPSVVVCMALFCDRLRQMEQARWQGRRTVEEIKREQREVRRIEGEALVRQQMADAKAFRQQGLTWAQVAEAMGVSLGLAYDRGHGDPADRKVYRVRS